jgi:outer membrane receptor protein involved in Fe transport
MVGLLGGGTSTAQTVQGTVVDAEGEALPGVNVSIMDTYRGTTTDARGNFALDVSFEGATPRLRFTFIGYEPVEIAVDEPASDLRITMRESVLRGDEIIVSASRVDERILETPVTVDRLTGRDLVSRPSTELMASMESLKGVDVSRSSMLISSLSTRGFNSAKSERLIQLVDYTDYLSPSLSIYPGNISGPPQIDLASVDIIHGANSALYGANAFNGVVVMNTRDPFEDQGINIEVRGGTREMYDISGRYAETFGNRVAVKLVGRFMRANEFISRNFDAQKNSVVPGNNLAGDPRGFDAVNRYGSVNLSTNSDIAPILQGFGIDTSEHNIFTPGFEEAALVPNDFRAGMWQINPTISVLLTDQMKATYWYRYAEGRGIYQSSNRFLFDDININTHSLSLEGTNWTVRGYRTGDKPGDTFDLNLLGALMNQRSYRIGDRPLDALTDTERDRANFLQNLTVPYAAAYAFVYGQAYQNAVAQGLDDPFAFAESEAAGVLPQPGQDRFGTAREATLNLPPSGASPVFDIDSAVYHTEAQYTVESDIADVTLGGNYRQFRLRSNGTLFTDGPNASPLISGEGDARDVRDGIDNYEYGGFVRLQRSFAEDRLSLSAVGRVDEFRNFDTQFSPRVSGVYTLGDQRQHNIRASYAQAFRAPAQLDQYIYLDIGPILLRGNSENGYVAADPFSSTPVAQQVQEGTLFQIDPLDVEKMNSIEVGYKGAFSGFFVDASYYYSSYSNFIGTRRFVGKEDGTDITLQDLQRASDDPRRARLMQVWLNADEDVTTQGFQAGLEYRFNRELTLNGNYTWAYISDDQDLRDAINLGFNTPEHKFNLGARGELFERLTYNANVRWHNAYVYQMPFAEGTIDSNAVLNAQLSYNFPELRTRFTIGGTNLTDSDNVTAYGSAPMGRMIYSGVSVSY